MVLPRDPPPVSSLAAPVVGVLLVGGKSERMGRDKAQLVVDGRRLVDRALTILADVCDRVVVVGQTPPPNIPSKIAGKDVEFVEDTGAGPLQALATFFARGAAARAWRLLAIVPVDMPGLHGGHLLRLLHAANHGACAAFHTPDGRLNLPVVVGRPAFSPLATAIERGETRLAKTLATLDVARVPSDDVDTPALMNVNTPQDLARFTEYFLPDDVRVRAVDITRVQLPPSWGRYHRREIVAEEEPLEIRVQGVSVAITMRTPGHDEDLVRGFLWTEGVVDQHADIARVAHCDRVEDPEAEDNIIDVTLLPSVRFDLDRLKRHMFAHSSCGVCGKATLEAALAVAPPLDDTRTLSAERASTLPDLLRRHQDVFERTGGLHAAGLLVDADADDLAVVREDVGRHNAIDKVVGATLGQPPALALVVSGRVSFEVVQKAARARCPILIAISAPTSLAIRLADTLGVTLVGFVRSGGMNLYSHPKRIVSP